MTSLETFLETEHLTYLPIYYYIDDNSGKKMPYDEKNDATEEEIHLAKEKKKTKFPQATHKNKKKINGEWLFHFVGFGN